MGKKRSSPSRTAEAAASPASSVATPAAVELFQGSAHIPVLYEEVLSFLPMRAGLRIVDGTLGLGGHSSGLLGRAAAQGFADASLLALDRDTEAISLAAQRLAPYVGQVRIMHRCFSQVEETLDEAGWDFVDFALVDIGVSSLQIDTAERGFSFVHDGPLDMRMDTGAGQNAAAFVNKAPVARLAQVIAEYGEEPMAGKIARAIDDARSTCPIETTAQLARVVEEAYPAKWRAKARNHPATRTFQALRMVVNDELGELERFLHGIVPRLRPGGRVAVITFHSLEDRIVKHFFRDEAAACVCPPHIPVCVCGKVPTLQVLTRKPVCATPEEAAANPRASSAKLRVAERV